MKSIGLLIQNLRILIRGLGRIGETKDLADLDGVKGNIEGLSALADSDRYKLRIQRLLEFIEASKEKIIHRK